MAKFKLGLLIQDIDQTNNNQLRYIEDIFTNFNFDDYYFHYNDVRPLVVNKNQEENYKTKDIFLPTTAVNNNIFFSYSYDESLTLKEHSQKQLQFKMLKYVQHNSDFLINPYAAQITNGTLIILYDKFNNISYFIITKISYSIKNANVEISYEAQDLFSYIHTRQNSGYTITNDETKEDFIGALTIDEWTNKIVDECKIAYEYKSLNKRIYKVDIYDEQDPPKKIGYSIETTNDNKPNPNWRTYTVLREPLISDYNAAITFSVSNSNALNALIQLAEQRGLNIQVDDKTATFYFIPAKAEEFSGLYYSPQIDISNLSISQQAQSLTTVLNVTGQTLNNQEITLLPSVPSMFLTLFSSERWKNEQYRPGFFQDFVKNQKVVKYTYNPSDNPSDDIYFVKNSNDYITQLHFQNQKVPFGNYTEIEPDPNLVIYISNNTIYTLQDCYDKGWININDSSAITFSGIGTLWIGWVDRQKHPYLYKIISPQQATLQTFEMIINFNTSKMQLNFNDIKGVNASVIFERNPTAEEEEFAKMADKLPWLENKLINVDYFYHHQLLSQNDYSLLLNILYNELRITNGQLIYYNNLYYAALLNKTNIMAELQNAIDVYMADFTYYLEGGSAASSALNRAKQSFEDLYNFVNNTTLTKFTLLTLEKTLEQYINNYYQYEQLFYKNIYKFRQKWNDKVYFVLETSEPYQTFTLGKFYETYKASNNEPILQQQAALIGTEFQGYWEAAYSASKYCGWYLPESFEDSVHRIYNTSTYVLDNTYLPEISIYNDLYEQGHINFNFNNSEHNLPIYVRQAFNLDYLILDNRSNSSGNNDFMNYLSWTSYTNINEINYYQWDNGGKKWNNLRPSGTDEKIFDTRLPIGGIWVILVHILLNKYYPQELTELKEVTEDHNNIWRELYKNFGNYLLENSYTDSLATNSEDLYNATMAFFKDQCAPEKSYDLSIIDIYALKGYTGQEVKVTDQIRIASQDFYQELDELKDILDQVLFVKEVQYKLRSDTDIKLSVNIIKYQDKMIKRLVKLIR